MTVRAATCLSAVLLAALLAAPGHAAGNACPNFQSPRNLDRHSQPPPVYQTSTTSIVRRVIAPDSIEYVPRAGGRPEILHRCSQHYHYPIEDPQGCPGELPPSGAPGTRPDPGQWVEFHTAYARRVAEVCLDPETLDCCLEPPVVVRAFSAKVTATGSDGPIVQPPGRPLFEWSGSSTSPDKTPDECKGPAQWSFRLSCGFTVSEAQLKTFRHTDKARGLQTGARLSHDLTLVVP
jgi:hypothetical protein